MKSLKILTLVILLVSFYSCNQPEVIVEPTQLDYRVTKVNLSENSEVMDMLELILTNQSSENGRTEGYSIGDINLESALKVENFVDGFTRYTFEIETLDQPAIKNLIIKQSSNGGVEGYLITYIPNINWIVNNEGKFDLQYFTGDILLTSLEGIDHYKIVFENGIGNAISHRTFIGDENGRIDCGGGGTSGGGSGSGSGGWTWTQPENGDFGGTTPALPGSGGGGELGSTTYIIFLNPLPPALPTVARVACDSDIPDMYCPDDQSGDALESDAGCPSSPIGVLSSEIIKLILTDLELHPCAKDIFGQIELLDSEGIRDIIDQFAGDETEFNYLIKIGTTLDDNVAETIPLDKYTYQTTFNLDYLNTATKVAIARTFLHEAIHAYIHSYLVGFGQLNPELSVRTFNQLWNEMLTLKYGVPLENIERYHHEEMARRFRDTVSGALKSMFGTQFSDQFYNDLAWGSLLETDAFENSETLTDLDKMRIRGNNLNEDKNQNAEGDPCD